MDDTNLWQEIVDELRGSCLTLDEMLVAFGAEDLEGHLPFHDFLDNQIFLCTACGWWCEIHEEASEGFGLQEWTCIDCCEQEDENG